MAGRADVGLPERIEAEKRDTRVHRSAEEPLTGCLESQDLSVGNRGRKGYWFIYGKYGERDSHTTSLGKGRRMQFSKGHVPHSGGKEKMHVLS